MAVRIVTDSSSDLPFSCQEDWDITILPLRVNFGEEEFVDGELTAGQFYEKLAQAEELPKTTQIAPVEFEDVLRPYVEAGDEVLLLPLSRELSGTFASARIAREQFPDAEIYVADTLQEGKVCSLNKARGMNAGCQMLLERMEKDGLDETYPVYFGNSNVHEAMEELRRMAETRFPVKDAKACDIGPIVGTHAGPGCVGLAFVAKTADSAK